MPTSAVSVQRFAPTETGWTDALRALISQSVTATHERTGIGVKVDFVTGSTQFHPAESELVGPEIATLNGFDDRSWMTWRPGEDAFKDL